ncbi:WYL domain-containing protein [Actinopolymorpha sp. B9G3]|uniref:helix-turn-helix transcriptional regulator n=1 Tax=Actinopolymorpha sp. B9G3 TaxID=3158970 RepID=UPI0032D8E43C
MLLLLQNRGAMTGRELARALEVSERTVVRDVEALTLAGVPVYADRGRAGGYRLVGGYRTRLTGLNRDEAEALFLSGVSGPLQDMGLADVAATAQLKVLAALPRDLRDSGMVAAQRFHLDVPRWFRDAPPPSVLAALATATWSDRVVSATYQRGERTLVRLLEPYGLVLKAGRWYAVGCVRGDIRVYRIDRFTGIDVLDQPFHRDSTFNLAAFWRERSAEFERSIFTAHARVRLSPAGVRRLWSAVERLAAEEAIASAGLPDRDGWVTVMLPVESLDIAYGQLVALGPEAEVLDPPALRARLAGAADRLSALYQ